MSTVWTTSSSKMEPDFSSSSSSRDQARCSWFATAELKFEAAHITGKRERFAHAFGAHQLTPVQKATKCMQVVASGNQRPSEVLASLLEYCSPGEEGTAFFRAAFTMRLPPTIQAHLTGMELTDLKELAQLADRLWQCNPSQPVVAVAAAAVR